MTRPRLCILLLLLALAWTALPALAQEFGLLDGDEAGAGNASQKTPAAPAAMVQEEELVVLAAPEKVGLGEPFLVRLTANRALGEVAVYWRGKEVIPSISVWNDRHVALAMLGTDVLTDRPGSLDLVVTAGLDSGKKTFRRRVAVRPKEYATQALNLPEPMVTPPEEVLSRIARERAEVARVLSEVSPKRRWSLPLKRPVAGQVTSVYGLRRILNGRPKNPHRGLDFRAAEGLAVAAAADV
ncbi:MAG: M23 family peptidase, partial [Desulfovibrionaceae bacterium]|nr:M23 family peptidase [Desulfovibrionaceae bacterium]